MMKSVALLLCIATVWVESSPNVRIIGGHTAKAGQFPFAAAIYKSTATGTYFCSGALINTQWVLTAGQCVDGAVLLTVRLGSNSLSANDPNALRLATDTFFLHPEYNATKMVNDVGLIKFRLPITETDYIKPISVLASSALPDSSSVITFGWGQINDENAGLVDELNYVYLTTLSNEECRLTYGSQVTDNNVCVSGNYNEGTCRGDLGSPLFQYGGTSMIYHVGISSFLSANGCESTDPSGFTRTSPYVDWINNVTNTY